VRKKGLKVAPVAYAFMIIGAIAGGIWASAQPEGGPGIFVGIVVGAGTGFLGILALALVWNILYAIGKAPGIWV